MQLFRNAVSVKNRQQIAFKCRACGACCKNVRDSIVLEPLDAYRIVRDKQKSGCTDSADDILWNMAELKELSPRLPCIRAENSQRQRYMRYAAG